MSESEGLLKQSIRLIQAGENEQARQLLIELLKREEHNDAAWVWMSAVVDGDDLRRECLQKALAINPANETARKGLAALGPGDAAATQRTGTGIAEWAPAGEVGEPEPVQRSWGRRAARLLQVAGFSAGILSLLVGVIGIILALVFGTTPPGSERAFWLMFSELGQIVGSPFAAGLLCTATGMILLALVFFSQESPREDNV